MGEFRMAEFKGGGKDNKGRYDLTGELPGLKKEDISLTYDNNYLTIATKHADSKDEKDEKGNFVRRERNTSSMSRSFYIDNIDEAGCTADYKDGILSVHMPKKAVTEQTGHTIAIGS